MQNGATVHIVDRPEDYKSIHEDDIGEFEARADSIMRDVVALAGHALQACGRAVGIHDKYTICEAFTEEEGDKVRDICAKLVSILDEAQAIGKHSHKLRTGDE